MQLLLDEKGKKSNFPATSTDAKHPSSPSIHPSFLSSCDRPFFLCNVVVVAVQLCNELLLLKVVVVVIFQLAIDVFLLLQLYYNFVYSRRILFEYYLYLNIIKFSYFVFCSDYIIQFFLLLLLFSLLTQPPFASQSIIMHSTLF